MELWSLAESFAGLSELTKYTPEKVHARCTLWLGLVVSGRILRWMCRWTGHFTFLLLSLLMVLLLVAGIVTMELAASAS
jgi:hypothetical protein